MRSINKVKLFFAFILACEFALQSDAIIRPFDACGVFEATCPDKSCIAKNLLCNGIHDCSDGADEINCTHYCQPKEFQCNNKRCVPKLWRCDSNDDCGDNSDEMDCSMGSHCEDHQFRCTFLKQCIPKSFRCDRYADCADGSDEHDCSTEGIITPPPELLPPPQLIQLKTGETFEITCMTSHEPYPDIVWRFNLGDIPKKCKTTNQYGVGTLTCSDIQAEDQGAYTCEGIHIKGSLFAATDTILVVDVCPNGFFIKETHECVSCFCSNVTKECSSAKLYKYHLKPSFNSYEFIAVKKHAYKTVFHITNERNYKGSQLQATPASGGVHAQFELEVLPYLAMPRNLLGNQLESYGGYLSYRLIISKYRRAARTHVPFIFPDVILMGDNITLLHFGDSLQPKIAEEISIGLIEGKWLKQGEQGQNRLATREEIMIALTSVQAILIKMQYIEGFLDTTITNINIDSACEIRDFKDLGRTSYVEECRCPDGYRGLSCQDCAPGFLRKNSLLRECLSERYLLEPSQDESWRSS